MSTHIKQYVLSDKTLFVSVSEHHVYICNMFTYSHTVMYISWKFMLICDVMPKKYLHKSAVKVVAQHKWYSVTSNTWLLGSKTWKGLRTVDVFKEKEEEFIMFLLRWEGIFMYQVLCADTDLCKINE